MSIGKEGGHEVEVTSLKKTFFKGRSKRRTSNSYLESKSKSFHKRVFIVAAIVVLGGVFWLFLRGGSPKTISTGKDLTKINQAPKVNDVVEQYSGDYSRTTAEVSTTGYKDWTKETVDKAYFNLIYADKIGAYTQVYNTLYMIESAGKNGIKIDDNSYGIDQKGRDQIKARADALLLKARTSAGNAQ